jgi:copper(I)-binding protein
MKPLFALSGLLLAGAFNTAAWAQTSVSEPWVRASVPQQKATGAFMKLHNAQGARLVEAKSPVAAIVEIHEMRMDNNVMKMRAINGLDLPAGKSVELQPGGYHIMLIDLKQQVKEGDKVPLTLVIEGKDKQREVVQVQASVKALNSAKSSDHSQHQHHRHKH